jgi:hypothetical protein
MAVGPLTVWIPRIVGFIGFAVPFIFLPRDTGTFIVAASLGTGAFYEAEASFGIDAANNALQGDHTMSLRAATVLSLGMPPGLVCVFFETGLAADIGLTTATQLPLAALAAAAGYVYLRVPVYISLIVGSTLTSLITLPIAAIAHVLQYLINGCWISHIFRSKDDCLCSEANENSGGKSQLIQQWLDVYYQTSGDQRKLRQACLEMELTRGAWASTGDDPNVISKCGGVRTNMMDNPMACLSAGAWTFGPPDDPDVIREPALNEIMWTQIYHCLDATNPSMLPPVTDEDKQCQKQYGEHFRWDTGTFSCRNQVMPGPAYDSNNQLVAQSLQGPTGGTDPTVGGNKSECTIL